MVDVEDEAKEERQSSGECRRLERFRCRNVNAHRLAKRGMPSSYRDEIESHHELIDSVAESTGDLEWYFVLFFLAREETVFRGWKPNRFVTMKEGGYFVISCRVIFSLAMANFSNILGIGGREISCKKSTRRMTSHFLLTRVLRS